MKNPLAALAAALILAAPLAASAQDVPSYAASDAQDQQDQQIRGRVENFDGGYNLQVRDDQGYVDNVTLHDGTIINPTGLSIAPGMVVSILGYNAGDSFAANEIDTPYSFDSGVPYYDGHPWGYYGSSIDLNFFFGNVGWWHGNDFGGGYRYDRGVRIYNDVHVRNDYRNDSYRGGDRNGSYRNGTYRNTNYDNGSRDHAYVAPPAGGYNHPSYAGNGNGNGYTNRTNPVQPRGFAPGLGGSNTSPGGFAGRFTRSAPSGNAGGTFRGGGSARSAAPAARGGGESHASGGGSHGGGGGHHR